MIERLEHAQRARRKGDLVGPLRWLRGRVWASATAEEVGELADLLAAQRRDVRLIEELLDGLGWNRDRYRGFDHISVESALVDARATELELEQIAGHRLLPALRSLQLADDDVSAGMLERAAQQLRRTASDAKPAQLRYVRGKLALSRGDHRAATVDLVASRAFNSQVGRTYQWAGRSYLAQPDGRRAAECFDMVLALPVLHWYTQLEPTQHQMVIFENYRGYDVLFAHGKFFAQSMRKRGEKIFVEDLLFVDLLKLFVKEIIRRSTERLHPRTKPLRGRRYTELGELLTDLDARGQDVASAPERVSTD